MAEKVVRKKGGVLSLEVYTSGSVVVSVNGVDIPVQEPLDIDSAKALLGWQEEPEDGKWKEYKFRDALGKKIRLANVKANRPLRIGIAQRYANEFLRGKWRFNGESFVFDSNGQGQDGQHRLVGLILAEQQRQKDPGKWKEYGTKGPITLDALVVRGVSPKDDVIDTLNIGQKRTLGDVIYRNHTIQHERKGAYTDKELQTLSNTLAVALRLTWLRVVNKAVNDAPHFPHSEAMDFLRAHDSITKAVLQIADLEEGSEKKISKSITCGYASGLFYLMAASKTDPDQFVENGVEVLDLGNWGKAKEFWTLFATGKVPAAHPIMRAKQIVRGVDSGGAQGREEIIRTIIKAWNYWIEGKTSVSVEQVTVAKQLNEEKQVMVMAEAPRIGGVDTDWSMYNLELVPDEDEEGGDEDDSPNVTEVDPETGEEIVRRKTKAELKKAKAKKKAKKGKGKQTHETGWSIGDTVWVKEGDISYFGTIVKLHDDSVDVEAKDDGQVYTAAIKDLSNERPADTEALLEEEELLDGAGGDTEDDSLGEDEGYDGDNGGEDMSTDEE